jgi:DNA-binding MarR family transcriptional regulator
MRHRSKNAIGIVDSDLAIMPVSELSFLESTAGSVIETIPGVMDTMRSALRRHVGEQLTVPQFRCLAFISRHSGCTVSEVAGFMGVTKATASVMVDRLMRAGSILVVSDLKDRRRSILHISGPGKTQLLRIRGEARKDFSQAMGGLSEQELSTLNEGLAILRKTFRPEKMPVQASEKAIPN